MKRIASLFIEKVVFGFLCAIVPPKNGLMLFGSGFGRFSDNPKFLFIHFQKNPAFEPIWISSNGKEVKQLRKKGYRCLYRWSLSAFWAIVRAPFFIISHNVKDIFPVIPIRGIVINLWHGTPIKQIGFDSRKERIWIEHLIASGRKLPYERWDYFVSASPQTIFIFEGAMHLSRSKILPLGQPRTEFIREIESSVELKRNLGARLTIPDPLEQCITFLYTPTFRNNESATSKIKRALVNLDKMINQFGKKLILFKPHPLDKGVFDDVFFESLSNVWNVSAEDTQELLAVADVLITDYSSILFDYMITGKPIIAFIFDKESYISENGGLYFSFEDLGANVAHNSTELINLVLASEDLKNDYDSEKFNSSDSSIRIESFIRQLKT
ncbi:CDP-glycerol glycerophosphotransferase [Pricia antarctica]|uniref:CDP-glycerol glycerophosphotransferase n=1 Tax=Pricia antarctica TaxID=641691 RepID=A0A1G6X246_9FLAO|nr:CDP-glycerol glycerophosphotransferase family protein [Pricia antarctica]SDD71973.1 CDP-glycerol glycerophosphotransferase [Pricia antarctica]